jgi:hypothetical protein
LEWTAIPSPLGSGSLLVAFLETGGVLALAEPGVPLSGCENEVLSRWRRGVWGEQREDFSYSRPDDCETVSLRDVTQQLGDAWECWVVERTLARIERLLAASSRTVAPDLKKRLQREADRLHGEAESMYPNWPRVSQPKSADGATSASSPLESEGLTVSSLLATVVRPSLHIDYTVVPLRGGRLLYRALTCHYVEEEIAPTGHGATVVSRHSERELRLDGDFAMLTVRLPPEPTTSEFEFAVLLVLDPRSELSTMPIIPYGCLAEPDDLCAQRQSGAAIEYLQAHLYDRIEVDMVRALIGDLSLSKARDATESLYLRARVAWGALERGSGQSLRELRLGAAVESNLVRRPLLRSVNDMLLEMAADQPQWRRGSERGKNLAQPRYEPSVRPFLRIRDKETRVWGGPPTWEIPRPEMRPPTGEFLIVRPGREPRVPDKMKDSGIRMSWEIPRPEERPAIGDFLPVHAREDQPLGDAQPEPDGGNKRGGSPAR